MKKTPTFQSTQEELVKTLRSLAVEAANRYKSENSVNRDDFYRQMGRAQALEQAAWMLERCLLEAEQPETRKVDL